MDRLARLIAGLGFGLVVCLLGWSDAFAWGSIPPVLKESYSCSLAANTAIEGIGSTMGTACDAAFAKLKKTGTDGTYCWADTYAAASCLPNGYCTSRKSTEQWFCHSGASVPSSWTDAAAHASRLPDALDCENGGVIKTLANGNKICICPVGMKPGTSGDGKAACKPTTCPAPGAYSDVTQPDMEVSNVGIQCMGGCEVSPSSVKAGVDGKLWATWPFRSTGKACDGRTDPSKGDPVKTPDSKVGDPPVPCGANQCPGTVNGTSVCVPCKGTSVEGPSTAASGVTPGNDKEGTIKSEEKTTSCTGTQCTTTTTYKDANGNVVGSKEERQDQKSFCEENPTLSICKEGMFGGACNAGFNCEGDAVQCALTKEVHKRACEWAEVDEEITAIGEQAMNGEAQPDGHPAKQGTETSMAFASVIDRSDPIGGGCPSDMSFSVSGQSIRLPFSDMCSWLSIIGNIAVGLCMLAAAFIVFRD